MPNGSQKRPRDPNKLAKLITDIAVGDVDDSVSEKMEQTSKAGKKGGEARAKALTAEKRSEIAKKAAAARWGSKKR